MGAGSDQPHVLVVHDEPGVRSAFRRVLAAVGWNVSISDRTGTTAAELLATGHRVDVMLIPTLLEGERMARRGIARAAGREVPVVAVDMRDLADAAEQIQAAINYSTLH